MVGWASETTLDVEYAHAIAPGARILLVETPGGGKVGTVGMDQIVTAEKYVISHHLGGVISQSFVATEQAIGSAAIRSLRGAYQAAYSAHVTVLAGWATAARPASVRTSRATTPIGSRPGRPAIRW